eukprot:2348292-Amphidinium_carterae.4
MKFQHYVNVQDVIEKWWNFKARAFVVYVSENGHRQWPVGGYWDLEILTCSMQNVFMEVLPQLLRLMREGQVSVRPTTQPYGPHHPVIPNHLAAMLDPQIPWWDGCDFPINSNTELVETWRSLEQLIDAQSQGFPKAYHNATMEHYNMLENRRWLQKGLENRIHKMYVHVNYGRGIPVVISSCTLTTGVTSLLGNRVKVMENAEWNKHNMSELQQLGDKMLTGKLQQHMERTAMLLAKVEEKEREAPGLHAGAPPNPPFPPVVPTIVHQTQQQVAITITPGPMWKTTEFDESDVWLVGDDESMLKATPTPNMTVLNAVPALNMTENTWTSTNRVSGIVKANPLKAGVPGLRAGTPEFYVDYLQVKGIASNCSIRHPTRSWFRDHFILPEHHGFTQVELQSLEVEGVNLKNMTVSQVEGMWILNSYTTMANSSTNQRMVRHVKLVEVGAEGTARRASLIRKQDPERFKDKRWNGSPSCLQITREEYLEQFLYSIGGNYKNTTEEQKAQVGVGDIGLRELPWEDDCTAKGEHCGPCGGTYGLSAEGGLICASHVAVLDCAEGLMVVVSDPGKRMNGSILRPTKRLPNLHNLQQRRRKGSMQAPLPSNAALWEQLAMYKSIWLAAGLEYRKGAEQTYVKSDNESRGCMERITGDGQRLGLGISNKRRLFRAVPVESLTPYVNYQNEHINRVRSTIGNMDELSRDERRMLKLSSTIEAEHSP